MRFARAISPRPSFPTPMAADDTASESASASLRIAGIDEAGRGPLAGPVVVAAVVFAPGRTRINGLDDSKQLDPDRREVLYDRVVHRAPAWKVEFVGIHRLQATLTAMRRGLEGGAHMADAARIDGNTVPPGRCRPSEAWVGGGARDRSIMAASTLAKVSRDRYMRELHMQWWQYG